MIFKHESTELNSSKFTKNLIKHQTGSVLWHINHWQLFNAKSGLFTHTHMYMIFKHKSTELNSSKFTKNSIKHQTGSVLWHIIHCRLFNAKSFKYIYIKYDF